jgi:two-component system sensor histidine kinase ChvG
MITNLLTTKSLLRQFLTFNFFVFVILGFFTFLYLLAIEPELINKKSKKHQNIIENISLNLSNQKVRGDKESLEIFLYKSNFILDEVDQIRFYNFQKDILADSSLIDIDRKSLFVTERIQTLGINEQAALEQDKKILKIYQKLIIFFSKI